MVTPGTVRFFRRALFAFCVCAIFIVLCICSAGTRVRAADVAVSGNCGTNIVWTVDTDNVLFISCAEGASSGSPDDCSGDQAPWAEYAAGIRKIVIGAGVAGITPDIFESCTALETVETTPECTAYTAENGVLFSGDRTALVFYPPARAAGCYIVPAGTISVGARAFQGSSRLTSAVLPAGVQTVGEYAFADCIRLNKLCMADGLVSVSDNAFSGCVSLSSVLLPGTVTTVGSGAFSGCRNLTSVCLPKGLVSLAETAFQGSGSPFTVYTESTKNEWQSNPALNGNAALEGAELSPGHVHTWEDVYSYAPTCTVPGADILVCKYCGGNSAQYAAATGHSDQRYLGYGAFHIVCERCGRCETSVDMRPFSSGVTGSGWGKKYNGAKSNCAPDTYDNGGYDIMVDYDKDAKTHPIRTVRVGTAFTVNGMKDQKINVYVRTYDIDDGEELTFYLRDAATKANIKTIGKAKGSNSHWSTTTLSFSTSILSPGGSYYFVAKEAASSNFTSQIRYLQMSVAQEEPRCTSESLVPLPENQPERAPDNHSYMVINRSMTRDEAAEYCAQAGGHLAVVTSHEENDFIAGLILRQGVKACYWLGGSDIAADTWGWCTDEDWRYANWAAGQSGATGSGNAVQMLGAGMPDGAEGEWVSVASGVIATGAHAGLRTGFICEWEQESQILPFPEDDLPVPEPSSCASNGGRYMICTECGLIFRELTAPFAPDEHGDHPVSLTCVCRDNTDLAPGYTGDLVCDGCGQVLEAGKHTPGYVGDLTAAVSAVRQIMLRWTPVADATQYNVYRCNNNTGSFSYIGTAYAHSFADGGREPGETYKYYIVPVVKDHGITLVGAHSDTVSVTAMDTPSPVSDLTAVPSAAKSLRLTWTAVPRATQYNVYRYNGTKKAYVYTGTSWSGTYEDKNLNPGTTYYYKLVTVFKNDLCTLTSALSSSASAAVTDVPAAVDDLAVRISGAGELRLDWSAVKYATQYNIYRAAGAGSFSYITTTYSPGYTAKNLAAGTEYSFKVVSVYKKNGLTLVGGDSDIVSETAVYAPSPVTVSSVLPSGDCALRLRWDTVPYATEYDVYRYKGDVNDYVYIGTALGDSYTATGLNAGTTYYFRVRSVFVNDLCRLESAFSASAKGKALGTFRAPSAVSVTPTAAKELTLTWAAAADATQYNIYRSVNGSDYKYLTTVYTNEFVNKNLTAGNEYGYKVMSVYKKDGATITGDQSAGVSAVAADTPAPVGGLTAVPGGAGVLRLSWNAETYATQYNVYRYNSAKKAYVYIGTSYTTVYDDAGVSPGTTYYYRIVSVFKNKSVTLQSAQSASVSAKAVDTPSPVRDLAVAPCGEKQLRLTWTPDVYATQYNIYRYFGDTKTYRYIGTSYTGSYDAAGLTAGTTYYFKVISVYKNSLCTLTSAYTASVSSMAVGVPAAVGDLSAEPDAPFSIRLSWTPVKYATQYNIYRYFGDTKTYRYIGTSYSDNYTVTDLSKDVTYYFRIVSVFKNKDATLQSAQSSAAKAAAFGEPTPAKGVRLSPVASGVLALTWNEVRGATQYNVYMYNAAKNDFVYVSTVYTNSYTAEGLTGGKTYRYKVVSVYKKNGVTLTGGYSEEASAVAAVTPTPVSDLSARVISNTEIRLTWSPVANATQYSVYRFDDNKGAYSYIKTVYAGSFTDTGLVYGQEYSYVVVSEYKTSDITLASAYSGDVAVQMLFYPVAPVLTGKPAASGLIRLEWNPVANADRYRLYRVDGDLTVLMYEGPDTVFNAEGMTGGKEYAFQVKAVNSYGGKDLAGAPSGTVFVTAVVTPARPANLRAVVTNDGVRLTWDAVPGAAEYRVSVQEEGSSSFRPLRNGLTASTYTAAGLASGVCKFRVVAVAKGAGTELIGPAATVSITV